MKKFALYLLFTIVILAIVALAACGSGQRYFPPDDSNEQSPGSEDPPANGAADDTSNEPDSSTYSDISDNPQIDDPPNNDDSFVAADFSFKVRDIVIEMDQDINYVIEMLGEPAGVFEAPSCAFDGIDRVFGYSNMQIHTYPKGDSDHIHTISIRDDSIGTTEGRIFLGADLQDVFDAYGDDYEYDTGMYTYKRGLTTLEFFIEDGIVMGITYGFIIE